MWVVSKTLLAFICLFASNFFRRSRSEWLFRSRGGERMAVVAAGCAHFNKCTHQILCDVIVGTKMSAEEHSLVRFNIIPTAEIRPEEENFVP